MAKPIHKEYTEYSELGLKFIKRWNKLTMKHQAIKMAKEFGMSRPTLDRIRRKLGLPYLEATPGRQLWIKRIKKMYRKGKSTLWIAKVLRCNPQTIQNVLHKEGIKMRPQHVTNPLYFKTRCGMNPAPLAKAIKTAFMDGKTCVQIARELNIDPGTVSNKIRGLGYGFTQRKTKGGYNCQWCNSYMEFINISRGLRKQKFCGHSCKNKAKDYRRYKKIETHIEGGLQVLCGLTNEDDKSLKSLKYLNLASRRALKGRGVAKIKHFEAYLRVRYGKDFERAKKRLLAVKPIIVKKEWKWNGKKYKTLNDWANRKPIRRNEE